MIFKQKPKICLKCALPLTFEFVIRDTLEGQQIDKPKHLLYCKSHFLEHLKENIQNFDKPFIFYQPTECIKNSQMYYYTKKALLKDQYTDRDWEGVAGLLLTAQPTSDTSVVLIKEEVIKCANDAPLFKVKQPAYRLIDRNRFLGMVSDYLLRLETTFTKNGSFWMLLPCLDSGIYVWFNYQ